MSTNINWTIPVVGVPFGRIDLVVFYLITLGILLYIPRGIFPALMETGRVLWERITTGPAGDESG